MPPVTIFLILFGFYITIVVTTIFKEAYIKDFKKIQGEVEPFRKNISECARQVKATQEDIDNFLKQNPQTTNHGKCFVACILKRNSIIKGNKIQAHVVQEKNKKIHGENEEVMARLNLTIKDCMANIADIFEICEMASLFNDCMNVKMEHVLEEVTMERRMKELGRMSSRPDKWTQEEDELIKLVKDEL